MEPALVALDVQALQTGSGAAGPIRSRVAELALRLHRSGRLAAALIAPELPPPPLDALPPGTVPLGLIRWDGRSEARRLLASHPRLVHCVPAPLLHGRAGDPGGLIVNRHWSEAGVARWVLVDDLEDVGQPEDPDGTGILEGPRVEARLQWIRDSLITSRGLDLAASLDQLDRLAPARPPDALPHQLAVFGPFPPGGGGIGAYNARLVGALARAGLRIDVVSTTGLGWDPPPGVARLHAEAFGTDVRPASYDHVVYTVGNSDGHLATVQAALRYPGWIWLHEARLAAVATTALSGLSDDAFAARMRSLLERSYPGRPPLTAARSAGRSHLSLAAAGVGLTSPLAERSTGLLVNSQAAARALELDLPPLAARPPTAVLPPACPPLRPRRAGAEGAEGLLVGAFGVVSMGKRPDLLVDAAAEGGFRLAFIGHCPEVLARVISDRAATRNIADRVRVTGAVDDGAWWEWLALADVAVQLRDSAGGEMSAAVLDALSAGLPVVTNLASAFEYPEGTVELIPTAAPDAVTVAALIRRLTGPGGAERRRRLSENGQAFAAAHQVEHLAGALITAVLERSN